MNTRASAALQEDVLKKTKIAGLKLLLQERGLKTSGRKADLIKRLLQHERGEAVQPPPMDNPTKIQKKLLNQWFMKPFFNSQTKMGSRNEPYVLESLASFLAPHGIFVDNIFKFGLVQRKFSPVLATSVDGVAAYRLNRTVDPEQHTFTTKHMEWVSKVATETNAWSLSSHIPDLDDYGHAVDKKAIITNLQLWYQASRLIEDNQNLLPTARAIVPSMVAFWNSVKGGVDVY